MGPPLQCGMGRLGLKTLSKNPGLAGMPGFEVVFFVIAGLIAAAYREGRNKTTGGFRIHFECGVCGIYYSVCVKDKSKAFRKDC